MGVPAVFLRLSGCNILCQSENWVCDTIEVWRKGVKTPYEEVLKPYLLQLAQGAHLVITGGEPLLHQKKVEQFLTWFEVEYGFFPVIEVETNGTITPSEYLIRHVMFWNCSPKLSTSGETFDKRYKPEVISFLNASPQSIFKFVISTEEDIEELKKDYLPYCAPNKIYLMPAGENQVLLQQTRQMVAALCIENCWHYSDRLHVVIWDKKTGV
jgi:organic radical activating enzyme